MLSLIAKVNEALAKNRGRGNRKDEVLAGFLNELEANPEGIESAIKDYNFVYAATTQGAEGRAIRRAKKSKKEDLVTYDTVIIDEAARASPRDLLIPMAQAEKRIILVGDHRQLPHMIDEEIIRKAMESKKTSGDTQTADNEKELSDQFEYYIKHSMFEYLKKRLETLSAQDNIKRTCTLNEQYRSHPLLGNFINDHFYGTPLHPDESFKSPLKADSFEQHLPGLDGRPALWINVPGAKGHEEYCNPSYRRKEEAKVIAKQLKEWLDDEAGKNLTFGVISFYRAQSKIIMEEADKLDITSRSSTAEPWEIKEEYRFLEREIDGKRTKEERLRIGTVDSFQGMEFDVVFLSMVRSPRQIPRREKEDAANYRLLQTRAFGHLVSENRLCVSMSRQKKVLVVVGDAALAQSEICRDAVPALAAFYDLCKEEGKIREP
jgi:superfamily I DNA and/or RNA helicase